MCRQPLPPPLSPPSAKLMIMNLKEYGYQSRRVMRVPKKLSSSWLSSLCLKFDIGLLVFEGREIERIERLAAEKSADKGFSIFETRSVCYLSIRMIEAFRDKITYFVASVRIFVVTYFVAVVFTDRKALAEERDNDNGDHTSRPINQHGYDHLLVSADRKVWSRFVKSNDQADAERVCVWLGIFNTAEEAAKAYDAEANHKGNDIFKQLKQLKDKYKLSAMIANRRSKAALFIIACLDKGVIGSVEVISAFSEEENFVEQSNKEIDEPSSNALLDKKDLMEVAEREANGEQSVVMSTRNYSTLHLFVAANGHYLREYLCYIFYGVETLEVNCLK
ncbi:kinesin-like protein KIN-6 isoform X1 [Tanacetum coccineum]